ncbi:signal transduction histidine kinase [Variovorax boronicumulans]|uniref:sensor histidine kinase n=1 Tax=Variovorax boronicumulans TaxID=436515 RepID=UPI0027810B25|nr:ATP-binding protein [Variovorax boronicumulans]MDQ0084095.1 signal transduction histidine kinase [Variovorax boronicumulans]
MLVALIIGGATDARSADQANESASPQHALRLGASGLTPPAPDAPWQSVTLPSVAPQLGAAAPQGPTWFRIDFKRESASPRPWAVYLPYLYGGGQVWLNGQQVASVPESTDQLRVRWERAHLLPLPDNLLRDGDNELMVRAAPALGEHSLRFPRVDIGPVVTLSEANDRRQFWVRTAPQLTVLACLIVSAFVLFIWWRRPGEVLYGLFGLATVFWGIRTLTFVIEVVPVERWQLWRLVYLAATGGFVVVMALFAMRFAGLRHRGLERALAAYWLIGPVWLLLAGSAGEPLVNRIWSGGLIPIGIGIITVSFWAVWRERRWASAVMPAVLTLATLAGVHDYLISWDAGLMERVLPGWAGHRLFMLHHGANLMLLTMGVLLSLRFTRALTSLEQLNESLESRVADRERSLSANYLRLAALERQNAAAEERQLIMREIHDGLGSKLFTSLSRVERGDMSHLQIEESLRACIADMRLALDALAPEDHDLRTALGDFLFRWQGELEAAGVRAAWTIDMPDEAPGVPPHTTLQILRIAQEALTNVVKHARARQVELRLQQADGLLRLEIQDDGLGAGLAPGAQGRGIVNMRARAERLGGTLELRQDAHGTCVVLSAPLASSAA